MLNKLTEKYRHHSKKKRKNHDSDMIVGSSLS